MSVALRRLLILLILAGAAAAGRRFWRREAEPAASPQWPPFPTSPAESLPLRPTDGHDPGTATVSDDRSETASTDADRSSAATDAEARVWLEPTGGTCPSSAPIKAKDRSGIYHVPGGRFYDRTVPDRCYATEAAAEADGYRRSSS